MEDVAVEDAKRALTPANENPWYVLMTLYGEQDGEEVDEELHEKNRVAWNAWAVHAKASQRDEYLAVIHDLPSPDAWHTRGAEIRTLFEQEFARRNPHIAVMRCPEAGRNDPIEMRNLDFANQLTISRFFIPRIARFNESKFQQRLVAHTAIFIGSASFARCQFSSIVTFQNSNFRQTLDFRSSDFAMGLNLQSSKCVDLALMKSRFKGDLVIVDVRCSGLADMSSIKPLDSAKWALSGYQFSVEGAAYLNNTVVNGHVDFRQADFGWVFSSVLLNVSGNVDFSKAHFAKAAYFGRSTFGCDVSFFQGTFLGRAYFDGVLFAASAPNTLSFQDCSFKEPTTFHGARFAELYPYFGGAILHDKTAFTDRSYNWPKGLQAEPTQAKAACAVVRHTLGKQGLPEAEHFFFRREMGFAGQIGTWWERLPYRLFGFFSDYGYSIERPAISLFWVWFLPAFFFAASRVTGILATDLTEVLWAAALSFANLFPIFGFHRVWFDAEKLAALSPWLKTLAGAQTVVSLPLLFFLTLGLRTRFRMR